jgi:hypothetical protein
MEEARTAAGLLLLRQLRDGLVQLGDRPFVLEANTPASAFECRRQASVKLPLDHREEFVGRPWQERLAEPYECAVWAVFSL